LNKAIKVLLILVSIFMMFSVKVKYGGKLSILLNEPVDFTYSTTNYSDTIFYSFIHENLFYMKMEGTVYSNVFKHYSFNKDKNVVTLEVKGNLSFSNGSPINGKSVHYSLKVFFNKENSIAKRISRSIKKIETSGNKVFVYFNYEIENIFQLLAVPELVLLSMNENAFSGLFVPDEWEKKKYIKLIPNRYYCGGLTYLDYVRIIFRNEDKPDMFLAEPNLKFTNHKELESGIYQNIYLTFPMGKIGKNTKIALYSFLKIFFNKYKLDNISSLTSDKESPISVNIKQFPMRKIKSILRNSQFQIYINSSLKKYEDKLNEFIRKTYLKMSIVFIKNSQLREFTQGGTKIKFYLTEKMFTKKTAIEDKIKKIIFELTFSRFNEKYLQVVNELDEIKYLKNNELMMDKIASVVETLINKEFILPIKQKKFSLYYKDKFANLFIDYFGRPVFHKIRLK